MPRFDNANFGDFTNVLAGPVHVNRLRGRTDALSLSVSNFSQ